jgi:hypothetical protein
MNLRRRFARALAAVAVVAAAAAGASYATARLLNVSTTVIQACQNGGDGLLRVVADNQSGCHANETAVSWNVQGPKGDQGPPGPPGPAGAVATLQSLAGTSCRSHGVTGTLDLFEPAGLIATLQAVCLTPDASEPNDTQGSAAGVPERSFNNFQVGGTIYPAGDEDWYSLSPQFGLRGLSIVATGPIAYEIFVDGTLAKVGTVDASSESTQFSPPPGPHAFLVHVAAASAGATAA